MQAARRREQEPEAGAAKAARPIVIVKKVKRAGHAHHGGAWKVAYADFVTAMMAFFLLLWLINMTSPEQKRGIADYFTPSAASLSKSSGAGGVLGGQTLDAEGSLASGSVPDPHDMTPGEPARLTEGSGPGAGEQAPGEDFSQADAAREARRFAALEARLRAAAAALPGIGDLSEHLLIDQTAEGLRIQIIDTEARAMFPPASAELYPRTRVLLARVTAAIRDLPNRITISGHTDSGPFAPAPDYSNWELSAARANAARREMVRAGLSADRLYQVSGRADTEPLFPEDPYMAGNRRVSITLMREAPVLPPGMAP